MENTAKRIEEYGLEKLKILKKRFGFIMFIIGLILLGFLIKNVGMHKFVDIFLTIPLKYLLYFTIVWIGVLIIGTLRLNILLHTDVGFFSLFKIYTYSFLLNYASVIQGIGIGAKIGMLKTKKVDISESVVGITSEIGYDIITAILIVVASVAYYGAGIILDTVKIVKKEVLIVPLLFLIIALIGLYILRKSKFVQQYIENIIKNITPKKIAMGIFLTLLMKIGGALILIILFTALKIKISFILVLFGTAIGFLVSLITFIPGGIGIRETIWAYVYTLSGIDISITSSVAVITRILSVLIVIIVVVLFICYSFLKKRMPTTSKINKKTYYEELAKIEGYDKHYYLNQRTNYFHNIRRIGEIKKEIYQLNKLEFSVDCGCGEGQMLDAISKKSKYTIGCDISFERLKIVKKNMENISNVFLVCCDINHLPFKEERIDALVCSEVIEHLEKDNKAIDEISRIIKKGGSIIVTTPSQLSLRENTLNVWNMMIYWYKKMSLNKEYKKHITQHINLQTKKEIKDKFSPTFYIRRLDIIGLYLPFFTELYFFVGNRIKGLINSYLFLDKIISISKLNKFNHFIILCGKKK